MEVRIDSRIMVDAACFRKMNPNYFGSTVINLDHGYDLSAYSNEVSSEASSDDASIVTPFGLESSIVEQPHMTDEYLLICCPTVPGFSFKDKMWGKIHIS